MTRLYYIVAETFVLYVILYVDDGLVCGNDIRLINDLLKALSVAFKIAISKKEFLYACR